jgi:oligopeptide transport system ATP-binding protein
MTTAAMTKWLEVRDVDVDYPVRSGIFRRVTGHVSAVSGASFDVAPGETLGLVGESGCGKTSLARAIVGLTPTSRGQILVEGQDVSNSGAIDRKILPRRVQMVFQDPYSSLNPRMTVREIVTRAWQIHPDVIPPSDRETTLADLLARVGLNPDHADRYPHQFSGGQRQRIGIARALALRPHLIVCDEAVSALDVSIRAQIINLLQDLQAELGIAYLFIAHDLSIVEHLCDRVAVMYLGKIVEIGERDQIFRSPTHPYTQSLLDSVPVTRPWRVKRSSSLVTGDPPSPANPPSGCRFHTRCPRAQQICSDVEPPLAEHEARLSACHFAGPRGREAVDTGRSPA